MREAATAGGVRRIGRGRTNPRNRPGGVVGVGWTNPGVFSTPRLIPFLSAICNCFVSSEGRGVAGDPRTATTRLRGRVLQYHW